MSTYRVERVNQIIKDELSGFINYEMNDPRIKEAVITVTEVKATPDMKYAKVFLSGGAIICKHLLQHIRDGAVILFPAEHPHGFI